MNRMACIVATAASVALAAAPVRSAQTLLLGGGRTLSGEVLRVDANSVIVDLGFDLLRIPRSQVLDIRGPAEAPAGAPAEPCSPVEDRRSGGCLYHTASLGLTTIEANVDRHGETVVMVTSPSGQGSGFLINAQGHLITNYHVIAQETQIKVTVFHKTASGFQPEVYKQVKIVALNPFVDLALLKIDGVDRDLPYAYIGDTDRITVGETVFAIGNPLGLTRTVSQGIVSTKNRNFDGQLYIQTTTDINPGNSGGPLFNLQGEVIGVTSMGYLFLGGLNFAIPADVVKRFVDNWDAFAYSEDNPNSGVRYLQPSERKARSGMPVCRLPDAIESKQEARSKR